MRGIGAGDMVAKVQIILLAADWRVDDILRNDPNLTHEDLLACLRYAGEPLRAGFPINRYTHRDCSRAMSG